MSKSKRKHRPRKHRSSSAAAKAPRQSAVLYPTFSVWRYAAVAVGLMLIVVAHVLRLWGIDHIPGLNGDEAWHAVQGMLIWEGGDVSWRTPMNNFVNPFMEFPLALIGAMFDPAVWVVRLLPMLYGVAALVINFVFCRRLFGAQVAWASTVLMAVLPLNIAYSRFGWEASQMGFWTLLSVYMALCALQDPSRRAWYWAGGSLLVWYSSIFVHPTCMLLAPMLALCFVVRWWGLIRFAFFTPSRVLVFVASWASVLIATAGGLALLAYWWSGKGVLPKTGDVLARTTDVGAMVDFVRNFSRLFSGIIVMRHIPGDPAVRAENMTWPSHDWGWVDVFWIGLFVVAAVGCLLCVRSAWQSRQSTRPKPPKGSSAFANAMLAVKADSAKLTAVLFVGIVPTMIMLYLVKGNFFAWYPAVERYAMAPFAPATVLLCLGWLEIARRMPGCLVFGGVGFGALCLSLLLFFNTHYLQYIKQTGGDAYNHTYSANDVDLKLSAVKHVLAEVELGKPHWLVAEDFWTYWPFRYFAHKQDDLVVMKWREYLAHPDARMMRQQGRVWFGEYIDTQHRKQAMELAKRGGQGVENTLIEDYSGRPIVHLMRVKPVR